VISNNPSGRLILINETDWKTKRTANECHALAEFACGFRSPFFCQLVLIGVFFEEAVITIPAADTCKNISSLVSD